MITEIKNDTKKERFYIEVEGDMALLDYAVKENTIDLFHTYTPVNHRGKGLAGRLVEHAFNYAKENGLKVIPSCPFVPYFIEKNPQYKELVAED